MLVKCGWVHWDSQESVVWSGRGLPYINIISMRLELCCTDWLATCLFWYSLPYPYRCRWGQLRRQGRSCVQWLEAIDPDSVVDHSIIQRPSVGILDNSPGNDCRMAKQVIRRSSGPKSKGALHPAYPRRLQRNSLELWKLSSPHQDDVRLWRVKILEN